MNALSFGPWRLHANDVATSGVFAEIEEGAPEVCGCAPCLNFCCVRRNVYPKEFRRFLRQLGVPYDCESEVYHNCRMKSGLHSYGGWFHFVGQLLDCSQAVARASEYHRLTDTFAITISDPHRSLVPPAFPRDNVIQIHFDAEVPWVLDAAPAP